MLITLVSPNKLLSIWPGLKAACDEPRFSLKDDEIYQFEFLFPSLLGPKLTDLLLLLLLLLFKIMKFVWLKYTIGP